MALEAADIPDSSNASDVPVVDMAEIEAIDSKIDTIESQVNGLSETLLAAQDANGEYQDVLTDIATIQSYSLILSLVLMVIVSLVAGIVAGNFITSWLRTRGE